MSHGRIDRCVCQLIIPGKLCLQLSDSRLGESTYGSWTVSSGDNAYLDQTAMWVVNIRHARVERTQHCYGIESAVVKHRMEATLVKVSISRTNSPQTSLQTTEYVRGVVVSNPPPAITGYYTLGVHCTILCV